MNSEIMTKINMLKGKKIRYIGRTCDMVDIGFGKTIYKKNHFGKEKKISEFSLHIQCPFRIVNENNIIVGYSDLFIARSDMFSSPDVNVKHSTLFDEKVEQFFDFSDKEETVINVVLNNFYDLNIYLNHITIQLFISNSNSDEAWRFFQLDTEESHVVVNGNLTSLE